VRRFVSPRPEAKATRRRDGHPNAGSDQPRTHEADYENAYHRRAQRASYTPPLLAAAPLAAAAAAIPTAALAIGTAGRTAWTAALAKLAQAKAEDEAFSPGHFKTWQKCRAEC
jgi:hypothetical protein